MELCKISFFEPSFNDHGKSRPETVDCVIEGFRSGLCWGYELLSQKLELLHGHSWPFWWYKLVPQMICGWCPFLPEGKDVSYSFLDKCLWMVLHHAHVVLPPLWEPRWARVTALPYEPATPHNMAPGAWLQSFPNFTYLLNVMTAVPDAWSCWCARRKPWMDHGSLLFFSCDITIGPRPDISPLKCCYISLFMFLYGRNERNLEMKPLKLQKWKVKDNFVTHGAHEALISQIKNWINLQSNSYRI